MMVSTEHDEYQRLLFLDISTASLADLPSLELHSPDQWQGDKVMGYEAEDG